MDFDALRAFAFTARYGNFTRAGEKMNLTQSAISRQVAKLEEGLGAVLFVRHTRGITLTEAGEALISRVEAILTDIDSLRPFVQNLTGSEAGKIRITTDMGSIDMWLMKHLPGFLKQHPEVSVSVNLSPDPQQIPVL